jgi:alpha-glucosidase
MFIADHQYYCGVYRFAPVDFVIVILVLKTNAKTAKLSMSRRTRTAAAIIIAVLAAVPAAPAEQAPWWTHAVIYEIYPRSFQDTDGDGVGDLKGVTRRLDYLKELGIDAIWLTPFYPSPNVDFGYDVSDYTNVAPEYGTMADWHALVREANKRGIRVLVDLVLNHSSDQHPWFKESRSSIDNPKRDWYIWRNGAAAGEPPTHWESILAAMPGPWIRRHDSGTTTFSCRSSRI